MIFDNSAGKHNLIAQKALSGEFEIIDETKFKELKGYENCSRKTN